MQPDDKQYGIVILAAGKSLRLGKPKQLLSFEGESLIRRIAGIALQVSKQVIVVTGAENQKVEEELQQLPVIIAYNENFNEGIASSIRTGVQMVLKKFREVEGVIFLVCDQPYISASLLKHFITEYEKSNKIVAACIYNDSIGTPVLFDKQYFPSLLQLKGDSGAKKIIHENLENVITINFLGGAIDIDTHEDYRLVLENNK